MSRRSPNRLRLAADIVKGASERVKALHENGFKTACTSAVLAFYGIEKKSFKFSQTTGDMIRILNKNGFSAVNVGKQKETKKVIGKAVKSLGRYITEAGYYMITNPSHVFLAYVSDAGEISFPVDTCPEYNRRIESIHRIKILKKKAK